MTILNTSVRTKRQLDHRRPKRTIPRHIEDHIKAIQAKQQQPQPKGYPAYPESSGGGPAGVAGTPRLGAVLPSRVVVKIPRCYSRRFYRPIRRYAG